MTTSCPAAVRAPRPAARETTLADMRGLAYPAQRVLEVAVQVEPAPEDPVVLQVRIVHVTLLGCGHDGVELRARDAELLRHELLVRLDLVGGVRGGGDLLERLRPRHLPTAHQRR